jgi:D-amino-acid dehydrogenase
MAAIRGAQSGLVIGSNIAIFQLRHLFRQVYRQGRQGAMTQSPIIIIGAGVAGVTSFYELAARAIPTVLIDSQSQVAQGASFANGAVLHPSLPDPWNNPGIGAPLLASIFNPLAPMKLHLGQVPKLLGWGADFLRNSSPSRHRAITQANYTLAQYSTRQTDALRHTNFEAISQSGRASVCARDGAASRAARSRL